MQDLKSTIESILFVAGRPVTLKELQSATSFSKDEIQAAISKLKEEWQDSGIIILEQNETYLMSTNPANSGVVKEFLNAELRERLTEAAIETLAIVIYKQPVTRAEIESIRGVNSQYTLRLLIMRGLIERVPSPKDARINLYRSTHEFLQHLGLKDIKELPDFEELITKVKPPEGFGSTATPPTLPPPSPSS